ncbi:hypothetical protein BsWGS_09795 [Bradybaena similaris]
MEWQDQGVRSFNQRYINSSRCSLSAAVQATTRDTSTVPGVVCQLLCAMTFKSSGETAGWERMVIYACWVEHRDQKEAVNDITQHITHENSMAGSKQNKDTAIEELYFSGGYMWVRIVGVDICNGEKNISIQNEMLQKGPVNIMDRETN